MSGEGRVFFDKLLAARADSTDREWPLPDEKQLLYSVSDDAKLPQLKQFVKVVSPMVRYSKLPFRLLCRRWGADLAYTPMIVASGFNASDFSRDSDFSSNAEDDPLIVQFAADDPVELSRAVQKTVGVVQGVNINCGCPQKWILKKRMGAFLSSQPQMVYELVAAAKAVQSNLPVSIKIRIHKEGLRKTIDLVQQAEKAGIAWLTIHGRTANGNKNPVDLDAIKLVKSIATVPIVANGDINSLADCERVVRYTNVDGVMCARGLLKNPAMYAGYPICPLECAQDYLGIALEYGGLPRIHRNHLADMMAAGIVGDDRKEFSSLYSMPGVIDFFEIRGWWPKVKRSTVVTETTTATATPVVQTPQQL